ncbi:hypothetical protein D3C87_2108440 [compost metagenome]
MPAIPTPLVPPWISSVSPFSSRASQIRLFQAVKNTSGSEAASMKFSPRGIGMH